MKALDVQTTPESTASPSRVNDTSDKPGTKNTTCMKKKQTPGTARKHRQKLLVHRVLRLAIQVVFFIFAPGVFISAMNGIHYLCSQVGSMQGIEAVSFVTTLVAVLAYTVIFGRFFCGYACAFGTAGDVLYLIGTPLRKALNITRIDAHPTLAHALRFLKYVVLIAVCIACFNHVWDFVSAYNPWTVFGILNSGSLEGINTFGAVLLAMITIMQLLFERSFCRFLCPMGAAFSLMPVVPWMTFSRKKQRCGKRPCNRCIDHCPAGIYPDLDSFTADECFQCGRCADICPLSNVHLVCIEQSTQADTSMGTNASKKQHARFAFKGTSIPWVLTKAVLLFLLFYFLGILRYLQ